MTPFFSIISVSWNDAWALLKTSRSVFRQSFKNFEYVIVDGDSKDGTQGLIEFWQSNNLVSQAVSEPDSGVYSAMNKALKMAKGEYVCFLNAGDVFAADDILSKAYRFLNDSDRDGLLGWGELNGQIWASWIEHEAFKLSSLGFCHQALFVKRSLLLGQPFDERSFKTDSDTLQLSRLYEHGAKIEIVPEIFAVRSADAGISADLERTKVSIQNTLIEEYPPLNKDDANSIIAFRREGSNPQHIQQLMEKSSTPLSEHLGYLVLDTLFQRPSCNLDSEIISELFDSAKTAINDTTDAATSIAINRLIYAQSKRQKLLNSIAQTRQSLDKETSEFKQQESARISALKDFQQPQKISEIADITVSLTSFPARISTVHEVIQSLLAQTIRPGEIHLWLGKDEIPNRHWLPQALLELEPQGLQIHFVERTFHHYDKFLHNSSTNKTKPFIIVDDDVIYPPTSIEKLMETHHHFPDAVVGNRCHLMALNGDGAFKAYSDWQREVYSQQPSLRLLPTGAGGVLYPPGFLNHTMVTDINNILAHAPYADDIWLKACALARNIPTATTELSHGSNWFHRYTPTMKAGTLQTTNVELGLNDLQINRCLEWLTEVRADWGAEFLADRQELS